MNRSNNLLVGTDSLPLVVETYKMLRANLSVAMDGTDSNVVLITSSIPSEGKSTVSANLSIVLAQAYERVLLIEADMRKPVQSGMFGFETTDRGLSTVLQGVDEFESAVLRDVHPGMDLLPSGLPQMNPSELLGSINMKSLLSRLRSEYRYIIIDTPPANIVADSLSLSGQVAGVAIVVRHGVSTLKEVHSTVETLVFSGMKVLGFVLTDMPEETRKRVYYKRYYYDSVFEEENEKSLDAKATSNTEGSASRRRRSGRSVGGGVAQQ